jgi:hypothetical protein
MANIRIEVGNKRIVLEDQIEKILNIPTELKQIVPGYEKGDRDKIRKQINRLMWKHRNDWHMSNIDSVMNSHTAAVMTIFSNNTLNRMPIIREKDVCVLNRLLANYKKSFFDAGDNIDKIKELIEKLEKEFKDILIAEFKIERDKFINSLFSKQPWCSFSSETKDELKMAFIEICNEAHKKLMGFKTSRKIFYFHGGPGLGEDR